MNKEENIKEIINYGDEKITVKSIRATIDNSRFSPVFYLESGKELKRLSSTVSQLCDTPEEAVRKGVGLVYEYIDGMKKY